MRIGMTLCETCKAKSRSKTYEKNQNTTGLNSAGVTLLQVGVSTSKIRAKYLGTLDYEILKS
jgi:hypothetical protein